MKYLITSIIILAILIIAVAVVGFFYCAGQLNEKWDKSFIDREWETEFDKEQE